MEAGGNGRTRDPERALRASEVRYRRLFESAKDGILILDADSGKIIDVNPYLCDLLGYPCDEFLGKHIWDFGPFRDIVASKEAFDELQAMDYIAYEDLPLEASDGSRIDVGFVSNVYHSDGKRVIQCNIRDISKRKLAERAQENLEQQLRAGQKMEAIGRLAGGIAHDFNNLLSIIICYTEFAIDSLPEGSPIRDDLTEVEKASKLAAGLTRQLLAFSRKQVLQPVLVDLNRVVERIERMLRRVLGEDIELVHALAPDLGLMMADPSQLEQVIMNLVFNARDAMSAGGRLTIETRNVDLDMAYAVRHQEVAPGPYVQLVVTDTGSGMDAETMARVFEPFFTTKTPSKGTGLGLSTVYGIVRQSGGHIAVTSERGRGTTFRIHLPREATAERVLRTPVFGVPARPIATETILVVEDEEAVRNVTRRILVAAGYTVLTAPNGHDALALCRSHTGDLDLVLTDVMMPHMGGGAFVAELMRFRPATPVLFMSGYSDDAIAHNGRIAPGSEFIGKPFTAAVLVSRVRDILDRARPHRPSLDTPSPRP